MGPNKENSHYFDFVLACEVGVEKAILLGNVWLWVQKMTAKRSKKHFHDGKYWTYDTAKSLENKYPYLKEKSISRWMIELEKDKWIEKGRFNLGENLNTTNWYTIGERFYFFYNSPVPHFEEPAESPNSQNEEPTKFPVPQNEKPTPQNEEPGVSIPQNEGSESQNEEPTPQNEEPTSIYKDTDITLTDITTDNNLNIYPAGESDFSKNGKGETPPPPTPSPEVDPPPDAELNELAEYTQKLQKYRPLRESLAMLHKLNDSQIDDYINRFVIREWGIDNLKNRSKREVLGHCSRWIGTELRIEKEQAEKSQRYGNSKNGQRAGGRIPVREEPVTDLRSGFNRRRSADGDT